MKTTAGMAAMLCTALAAIVPAGALWATVAEQGIVPLKVIQTVEPSFPAAAQWTGHSSGEVHVVVAVDHRGRLTDWLVTAQTHESFTREAIGALRRWRFEPMKRDGVSVAERAEVRFKFSVAGLIVVTMSSVDQDLQQISRSSPKPVRRSIYALDELDRPIETLVGGLPEYPASLRRSPRNGKAVVDYYVDEEGRVRLPVIVEQDDEAFGDAVLSAAEHWRFSVPRRSGRPAITRVAQEFTFVVKQ